MELKLKHREKSTTHKLRRVMIKNVLAAKRHNHPISTIKNVHKTSGKSNWMDNMCSLWMRSIWYGFFVPRSILFLSDHSTNNQNVARIKSILFCLQSNSGQWKYCILLHILFVARTQSQCSCCTLVFLPSLSLNAVSWIRVIPNSMRTRDSHLISEEQKNPVRFLWTRRRIKEKKARLQSFVLFSTLGSDWNEVLYLYFPTHFLYLSVPKTSIKRRKNKQQLQPANKWLCDDGDYGCDEWNTFDVYISICFEFSFRVIYVIPSIYFSFCAPSLSLCLLLALLYCSFALSFAWAHLFPKWKKKNRISSFQHGM